ncbi:hypothetical protein NDA14_005623 [Ustilago hordei]|nr:hypothetical protein NDA14_005623 [Ustilago hordei]
MLVSRQALSEISDPGRSEARPRNGNKPQKASQAAGIACLSPLEIQRAVREWSKECSTVLDLSGFARQVPFEGTVQKEGLVVDFEVDATFLRSPEAERNADLLEIAFAKLLSVYTGDSTVCFASLSRTPAPNQDELYVRHCKADHALNQVPSKSAQIPLESLRTLLTGQQLWGASLSTDFAGENTSPLQPASLPIASTSLHVHVAQNAEGRLGIDVLYAPDTILAKDAHQIGRRFAFLLKQLHERTPISQLSTTMPGEKVLALKTFSSSVQLRESCQSSPLSQTLIHTLISRVSQRHSRAVAIHVPQDTLEVTYEQLGTSSDRLACQLRRLNVDSEIHVALMLDKSELLPVSILATLKAGGCATPLVDQLTDDRILHILKETQPAVWIVDAVHRQRAEKLLSSMANEAKPHLLCISRKLHSSQEPLRELLALQGWKIPPDSKAYTIYTSGSTGLPKAVILTHRNLAAFASAKVDGWKLSEGSRLLQFSAPVWDVSVGDLIYALTSGATLVMQDRFAAVTDVDATIRSLRITHAILTPTVADFIRESHASLEALILTGEPIPITQRNRLLDLVPTLLNGGAPSEVTILALMTRLTKSEAHLRWTPFGRPIGTVRSVILDVTGQIAPIGAVGELCLAGDQVSRGYLNQPDKTKAAFVQLDLASSIPELNIHGRFYRTGDLARLHADGRFELFGRMDGQLKYRGVRLEAQEIEGTLEQADDMVDRAFVCTKNIKNSSRLVAVLQPSQDGRQESALPVQIDAQKLITSVSAKLGNAATPNAVIFASSALPLTVSGKLDRKALQVLVDQMILSDKVQLIHASRHPKQHNQHQGETTAVSVAPEGRAQLAVAEAFGKALELDAQRINVHESLQDLGGDSLTAVRILTDLRKKGARIEVRHLLEGRGSIYEVAARVSFGDITDTSSCEGVLQPEVDVKQADLSEKDRDWVLWRYSIHPDWIEDMFYSTPYQSTSAGMGFAFKSPRPQSIEWNQAVWECNGPAIQADDLRAAWMATVEQYPNFRSAIAYNARFEGVMCVYKTSHCPLNLTTYYPRADVEHDRDFHTYMDQDRQQGHQEFGKVPFRLALIQATKERTQKLVIAFPHSLACGWSMRLTLQSLLCRLNGRAPDRTTPTSFKKYIAFTRSRNLDELDSWWAEELKGIEHSCWPIDYRTQAQVYPVVNRQFDAHLNIKTKELARTLGSSLFTITMAAFVLALGRRSRPDDISSKSCSRFQVATSYITSSRFFDGLEDLEAIRGPTLDVLLALFDVDLDEGVSKLLDECSKTINRPKGKEHYPLARLSKKMDAIKVRGALQANMVFQNLPSLTSQEGQVSMKLGREHMPTISCIFFQVTPSDDRLLFRTAFDDRFVSSTEATAFVDDMRCMIQLMADMRHATVRELLADIPSRSTAIITLPRPQPLEHFDLDPVPGSFWLRRFVRNVWLLLWYHLVLWPIRSRRL